MPAILSTADANGMQTPVAAVVLTLYTRSGCNLCDEMKDVVRPVAQELGCRVDEVDIAGDADLEARFGHEIPVLVVDGRKAFKYRVTERDLRKQLQRK